MKTLYDCAYELFGAGFQVSDYTISKLSAAQPGHSDSEYRQALDGVNSLAQSAHDFCSDWYDHRYTESEAMEKIRGRCPGFSEACYKSAWNQALTYVHR